MADITITIEGKDAQKRELVYFFVKRLVHSNPPRLPICSPSIEVVERTPVEPSVTSLDIKIDSTRVILATAALDDLAEAAARANDAITKLTTGNSYAG